MSNHKISTGKKGEEIAMEYLHGKGYNILDKNYRSGHSEIDLICMKRNCLIFVEVRTLNSSVYGYPEQTLSSSKISAIFRGAESYIIRNNWQGDIRFDIIAIRLYPDLELEHFQDAFY